MPSVRAASARAGCALLEARSDVIAPTRWLARIVRLQSRIKALHSRSIIKRVAESVGSGRSIFCSRGDRSGLPLLHGRYFAMTFLVKYNGENRPIYIASNTPNHNISTYILSDTTFISSNISLIGNNHLRP